ncbi:MAG TPA: AAA family ATPase [Bellilinea sp.]|nr:AAA family ATPase [Bellilinea sp.]
MTAYEPAEFWPTGSIALDWCFGGGIPKGRVTLIHGPESTGKTTLSLVMCKAAVNRGGYVAYVDAEHSIDPRWAKRFGLSFDGAEHFFLVQPKDAEEALNAIIRMAKLKHPDDKGRGLFDLIVLDSVASLVTKAQLAGEVGDHVVAGVARAMTQFLANVAEPLKASDTSLVLINQERDNIGGGTYASPIRLPGGKAQRYYASIRAAMRNQGEVFTNDDGEIIARTFRLSTKKNKVSEPNRVAEVKVYIDKGVPDYFEEMATVGKELGIFTRENGSRIKGNGAWFFNRDEGMVKVGVGAKQVANALDEDRELAAEVESAIRYAISQMNEIKEAPTLMLEPDDEDEVEFDDDEIAWDEMAGDAGLFQLS